MIKHLILDFSSAFSWVCLPLWNHIIGEVIFGSKKNFSNQIMEKIIEIHYITIILMNSF